MIERIADFRSESLIYNHLIHNLPQKNTFKTEAHNFYELIYIKSGDVSYVIEDRKYKLKPYDLIITRPARYHFIDVESDTDYERYDILFDERMLGIHNTTLVSEDIEVVNLHTNGLVNSLFEKIDLYFKSLPHDDFKIIMANIITELFYILSISDVSGNSAVPVLGSGFSFASPIISKAIKYINDNLFEIKDIGEISKHLYVTDSYFFRVFKKEMRQSPKKYINDKRLLAAQSLISTGKKPAEVCEICGFGDYTSFYRNYVNFFGYPPSKEHTVER